MPLARDVSASTGVFLGLVTLILQHFGSQLWVRLGLWSWKLLVSKPTTWPASVRRLPTLDLTLRGALLVFVLWFCRLVLLSVRPLPLWFKRIPKSLSFLVSHFSFLSLYVTFFAFSLLPLLKIPKQLSIVLLLDIYVYISLVIYNTHILRFIKKLDIIPPLRCLHCAALRVNYKILSLFILIIRTRTGIIALAQRS